MAKHKIYAFCNESLKYKIKNHRTFKFRCHEIRNDDTWQILNLKFQLLYSEFRELNSMFFFILNSILWNIFALPFDY